jgi:hypothetical protein
MIPPNEDPHRQLIFRMYVKLREYRQRIANEEYRQKRAFLEIEMGVLERALRDHGQDPDNPPFRIVVVEAILNDLQEDH